VQFSETYKIVRKLKVNLFLCSIKHQTTNAYGGTEVELHHLNLGTRWMWVVRFTSRAFYPWYSYRKLSQSQRHPGCHKEERKPLHLPGIKSCFRGGPALTWSLYRLNCCGFSGMYLLFMCEPGFHGLRAPYRLAPRRYIKFRSKHSTGWVDIAQRLPRDNLLWPQSASNNM
jgi:hypothetical protein